MVWWISSLRPRSWPQDRCRLWRGGQGQHAPELLRHRRRQIAYCVDKNPAKQKTLLPGSQIPVFDVDELRRRRPDFILILPWNLKSEIMGQLSDLRAQGTIFVTAVPSVSVTA
jgi:hypothetical protein